MSQDPPPASREPNVGASCLPAFAEYLGADPNAKTLSQEAGLNSQYVVVHMYLVPGDPHDRRRATLRDQIATCLGEINAIRLHIDAFAVPCARGDERSTAELAWQKLIQAGAMAGPSNSPRSGWFGGDIVYIHFTGADGMYATAATPDAGQPLPLPTL